MYDDSCQAQINEQTGSSCRCAPGACCFSFLFPYLRSQKEDYGIQVLGGALSLSKSILYSLIPILATHAR